MSVANLRLSANHLDSPRSWATILFAFFDETFQALTTAGRARFSAKAKGNGGKHGAFPTAVVTDNKIDKRAKLDLQVSMTHEILTGHRNDDTVVCRLILLANFGSLLACKLSGLFQEVSIVRRRVVRRL